MLFLVRSHVVEGVLTFFFNWGAVSPFLLPVSRLFWVSSLAYLNLLGTKGYVVVVVSLFLLTERKYVGTGFRTRVAKLTSGASSDQTSSCYPLGHVLIHLAPFCKKKSFTFLRESVESLPNGLDEKRFTRESLETVSHFYA
jgi:hypothetical protein